MSFAHRLERPLRSILECLLASRRRAESGQRPASAVRLGTLLKNGGTRNAVAYLCVEGLVRTVVDGVSMRRAGVSAWAVDRRLSARTMVVLTPKGEAALLRPARRKRPTPAWNARSGSLSLADVRLKQLRKHGTYARTVLDAFEACGWKTEIDDPLPPLPPARARRRLHDVVKYLNRGHAVRLMCFYLANRGRGVGWRPVE